MEWCPLQRRCARRVGRECDRSAFGFHFKHTFARPEAGTLAPNAYRRQSMLRELIDTAVLEDFVAGLAQAAGLRVCAYDAGGRLLAVSAATSAFAKLTAHPPGALSRRPELIALPADAPPAKVGFTEFTGVWYVFAPILLEDQHAGLAGVGAFRDGELSRECRAEIAFAARVDEATVQTAWEGLPTLKRTGDSHAVVTARWAARLLSNWCRRELRMHTATEQLELVGDIARLLTGEHDLQTVLDRIVAETARVMNCPYCSLRLYNPETDELTIQAVHNLSDRYLAKGPVLRSQNPIDREALSGKLVYIEDAGQDPRIRYPDQARAQGLVSGLTVGLLHRAQPVGVLRIYSNRRQKFRRTQRNLLRAVASQAATAIVHARLHESRLHAAETERQLALAGDVQARMVHSDPPTHPRIQTASIFDPCAPVGGDFCDFFTLRDGRIAAVVGDVVGKGIPASLLMASVRAALRAGAECCDDLGEILTRLNRHVFRETSTSEFVTLLLIAVDPDRSRLEFCSAGHEPLLLHRAGEVLRFDEGNLILGVDPDERYQACEIPLQPDDFVLLFSDGAIDAANFRGELFGRDRLLAALRQYGTQRPDQALKNIQWDIRRFIGLAERSDDLTLVGLRMIAT